MLVNRILVDQQQFHLVREDQLIGQWRWVYAAEGWEGNLQFRRDNGTLTFTGYEEKWINGKKEPLLELTNGTAHLIGLNRLDLSADVNDIKNKSQYHWVQTAPFTIVPAFRGEVRRESDDGNRWGMMFYKWPNP
jgi:hypothetical protein